MVEISNLTFSYGRKKPLFDGLDLELSGGNIYGLLGKNGAGKTTLLKLLCGLLFPSTGSSRVLGHDTRRRSPDFLQEVYFIPEEFHMPSITSATFRRLYGPLYPGFSEDAFRGYLHEFGIGISDRLSALSYGNKKKFLIAFGLATGCRLLILDEPTNGLDIPSKSKFRKLLAGALTEDRMFFVSTHQVRDMENLIDPIIILDGGRIAFHHGCEEIAERVTMKMVEDPTRVENVLYSEKTLTGYNAVMTNTEGTPSRIDLELLFNTVTHAGPRLEKLFSEGDTK